MKPFALFSCLVFCLLFSCKKDKDTGAGIPKDPSPAWKLDSGVYNPDSYFPLRVGAYWVYEHDHSHVDSIYCFGKVAYTYKHPDGYQFLADTSFGLTGDAHSHILKSGSYKEYYIPGVMCQKGGISSWSFFAEGYAAREFFYQNNCRIQSNYPICLCLAVDTTIGPYSNVVVFRETNENDLDSFEYEVNPVNKHFKLLTTDLKPSATYTDKYYAKGIGLVRIDAYSQGTLYSTIHLIRHKIK